jgi:hypothetical protein
VVNCANLIHSVHILLFARADDVPLGGSETYSVPSSTVTICRELDLASRAEIEILQQRLSCPAARVALFGIDGVG